MAKTHRNAFTGQYYPESGFQLEAMGNDHVVEKYKDVLDAIPTHEQRVFVDGIADLPTDLREIYCKRMGNLLKKEPVARLTGRRGLFYELEHIAKIRESGLETIDFSTAGNIGQVTYNGYSKHAYLNARPDTELTSLVDCDVPISRDGKPHMYELKSYSRKLYGSLVSNRNQLLKYEQAVEDSVVEGATIQLQGRLDPQFLSWATSTRSTPSPVPHVEILYDLVLPSGATYITVLKTPEQVDGLRFENPEYEEELDKQVIEGLEAAKKDGSLSSILALRDFRDASAEMQLYMEDPMSIPSVEIYATYEGIWRFKIYDKLLAKGHDKSILPQHA